MTISDKWKINDKSLLYLVISGILILMLIIGNFRYNRLNKQFNELKIQNTEKVDSLVYVNRELEKQISTYKLEVNQLEETVDSLQKVKNRIIVKKDQVVVSNSVSEGISKLKDNLQRWSEY